MDNVVVSMLGVVGPGLAIGVVWAWVRQPIVTPYGLDRTAGEAAADAVRVVACLLSAAFIAGGLVVGLGGRLVMRVLAATTGDAGQGRFTEAGFRIGEITTAETIGFVIFAGLILPIAASFLYLGFRRVLPKPAWAAGLVYGVALLGTFGVGDPLSPDNIDFAIVRPLWLAVGLVTLIALLYGVTFVALDVRLEATSARWSELRSPTTKWRHRAPYLSLVLLVVPFFAIPAIAYVGGRAALQGRARGLVDGTAPRMLGRAVVLLGSLLALGVSIGAMADILG